MRDSGSIPTRINYVKRLLKGPHRGNYEYEHLQHLPKEHVYFTLYLFSKVIEFI